MKLSLPVILALGLLAASPLTQVTAQTTELSYHESAQDAQSIDDDDEPVQRVARLSFVDGDVSFLRAGVTEWADVVQNLPLLTGDQLYVGKGGRAEIQLGNGNYVRLSERTAITIADLTHTVAQLELTEGTAIIRLERLGASFTRFEVDTPNAALVFDQDGLYRVNVAGAEESEIIIRRGSAEVATLDGSFKVREGHRLLIDSSTNGRLEVSVDNSRDDWDRWSYDRDQSIDRDVVAASPDYINEHEATFNCFYGASELAGYGSWTNFGTYGYCWVPRVASGWAPYRSGQWLWVPRVGWSWLAYEPWGWAPYHYGRWALLQGIGWAWVPGIHSNRHNYRHSYYQWRPALVAFFNCPTSRGQYVGWYPLAPGERWRRPERSGRDRNDHGHLRYPAPRNAGRRPDPDDAGETRLAKGRSGVSVVPVTGFTRPGQTPARPDAPDGEVARWVSSNGIRQGLPELGPTEAFAAPGGHRDGEGRSRLIVKPPSEVAARPVVTRNRPSTAQAEASVPRERRLVAPRRIRDLGDSASPFLGEGEKREGRRTNAGRSDGEANGNGGNKRREGIRAPETNLPTGDNEAQPRRRQREAEGQGVDAGAGEADHPKRRVKLEEEKPDQTKDRGNSGDSNEDSQRSRQRFRPVPPAGDGGSADRPKKDEDQTGHKPKAERPRSDDPSQPHSDEYRKRPNSEGSGKSRQEHTAPPAEHRERPRVEQKQEQHQEHREQKQERREERREERRKGNQ